MLLPPMMAWAMSRDPVPETSRVMCRQKPQGARGQNGEPVRLDNTDHRRVLVKRLAERTAPGHVGLQVGHQAEDTRHRQEHSINA